MFVHTVYFWLKADISAAEKSEFVEGVRSLTTIPSVKHGWVGTPADTDRPVIDRTYSYGLTVVFDDLAGHDVYQVHSIHKTFLELKHLWTAVKIYDFEG